MRTPTHIMIHHSLTADGRSVSWAAIEKYHRETMGWRDIGYHAGVELVAPWDGPLNRYAWQGLLGRGASSPASACPQDEMNRVALHVCCVGNFDLLPPPPQILDCLVRRVLLPWMGEYGIPADRIVGHRDHNPAKTCPGRLFDLAALRARIR